MDLIITLHTHVLSITRMGQHRHLPIIAVLPHINRPALYITQVTKGG